MHVLYVPQGSSDDLFSLLQGGGGGKGEDKLHNATLFYTFKEMKAEWEFLERRKVDGS